MKKDIIFIGFLGLTLAILLSIYNVANATVHTVTDSSDTGANTLRGLVSTASSGDTIRFNGISRVYLQSSPIQISKNLTIDGEFGMEIWSASPFNTTQQQIALFSIDTSKVVKMNNLDLWGAGSMLYRVIENKGNLALENCTISNLYVIASNSPTSILNLGTANLVNCTISGTAGGILDGPTTTATSLTNCTIYENKFYGIELNYSTATIKNTIFAKNTYFQPPFNSQNTLLTGSGAITSLGNNLLDTANSNFTSIGDSIISDLKINDLGDYGGNISTCSLKPTSPAINYLGSGSGAPSMGQRGEFRDSTPDVGAVEFVQAQIASIESTQNTKYILPTNTTDQQIIGLEIFVSSYDSPPSVTNFTFNTNGTTNVSDLQNAKLYYTNNTSSFPTSFLSSYQFGLPVSNPNGTFNISDSTVLKLGTNYFWLAYDIAENVSLGNKVDAECSQVIGNSVNQLSFTLDPPGDREVRIPNLLVTIQNDENDGSCFDGDCSLRDAVQNIVEGDTIRFATGIDTCDITLGELQISKNMVIDGIPVGSTNGVLVRRTFGTSTSFNVGTDKTVEMNNLTISNFNDTGLKNSGTLTLTDCSILNNNGGIFGGGIQNDFGATLTLESCNVNGNTSFPTIGGGGIFNNGNTSINNSTIDSNTTPDIGGGIYSGGTLVVTNSTISNNFAGGLTGPTAGGGGIFTGFGNCTLTNSTISGNSATKSGGGIDAQGNITITNCTITNNSSQSGIGGFQISNSSTANVKNTIFNKNLQGVAPSLFISNFQADVGSSMNSLGYNIEDFTDCGFTSTGDKQNTDAKLDSLRDNGGKTKTHALLLGSPAIGAGTSSGVPTTDQRGFAVLGTRDIGSYEFGLSNGSGGSGGGNQNPNSIGSGNTPDITLLPLIQNLDGTTPLASLQITNGSGGGSASMTTQLYNSQSSNAPNSVNFWWDIDVTGTWTADLTFSYAGLDLNGIDPNNLRVWHWNGSIWEDFGGTVNTIAQTITVPNLNQGNFSPFTLGGGDNPLAVELSYFKAESIEEGVKLIWRTESELNNKGFYIERKVEPNQFNRVSGLIEGQGTSASPYNYIFIDKHVKFGNTYTYRLIDVDSETGFEKEHREIKITFGSDGNSSGTEIPTRYSLHQNFPNPFNPNTTIKFDLPKARLVNLSIYNIKGQLVKTLVSRKLDAGFHSINWNGTDSFGKLVATGVYFYKIEAGSFRQIQKMTLLK